MSFSWYTSWITTAQEEEAVRVGARLWPQQMETWRSKQNRYVHRHIVNLMFGNTKDFSRKTYSLIMQTQFGKCAKLLSNTANLITHLKQWHGIKVETTVSSPSSEATWICGNNAEFLFNTMSLKSPHYCCKVPWVTWFQVLPPQTIWGNPQHHEVKAWETAVTVTQTKLYF